METELEPVVEQIIDVPVTQILEEIVGFEQIVDIPVLQLESFFFTVSPRPSFISFLRFRMLDIL